MKKANVWLILGGSEGLGFAAVKYLAANRQSVIAVMDEAKSAHCPDNLSVISSNTQNLPNAIKALGFEHGSIDYIINNSNYKLFDQFTPGFEQHIETAVDAGLENTKAIMDSLLPFLRKYPRGNVINVPPQLCLMSVPEPAVADKLAGAMAEFLKILRQELEKLDCKLTFLEPGQRLADFTV
jgi:NADP-dependent 3-hydroxy acid dehydrogenase YdfG